MLTPYVKDYDSAAFLRDYWRPGLRCLDAGAGETVRQGDWTRIDKYPPQHGVIAMDLHKLEFPHDHFDLITCSAVLQYCDFPQQVLDEFGRVLAPGGVCYISAPFMQPDCSEEHEGRESFDLWRFTLHNLRCLAYGGGLEVIASGPTIRPGSALVDLASEIGGHASRYRLVRGAARLAAEAMTLPFRWMRTTQPERTAGGYFVVAGKV